jgi:hypothetical protein
MPNYALTSVAVTGGTTTYNGTITGGAANAYVGYSFTVSGFTTSGNNVTFTVTASTAATLVCTTTTQANETNTAVAVQDPTALNYPLAFKYLAARLVFGSTQKLLGPGGGSGPTPATTGQGFPNGQLQ